MVTAATLCSWCDAPATHNLTRRSLEWVEVWQWPTVAAPRPGWADTVTAAGHPLLRCRHCHVHLVHGYDGIRGQWSHLYPGAYEGEPRCLPVGHPAQTAGAARTREQLTGQETRP
jgi:hypothetical protein